MKNMKDMKTSGPQFPVLGSRLLKNGNGRMETVFNRVFLHDLHGLPGE